MLKRAFSAIDDTPDTLGLQSETQSENDAATHDKKDAPMASTATVTTLVTETQTMTMFEPEQGTQPPSDDEQDKKKDDGSSSPDVAPEVLDDPEEPTAIIFDITLKSQTQACVLEDCDYSDRKIDGQVCCHIPMLMNKALYLSFKKKESGDLFIREVGESKWRRIIQDRSNVVELDKEGQVRVRADVTVTLEKKQHEEQCPEKREIG